MPNDFINDSYEDEAPMYRTREDLVNGPRHYNIGGIECIEAMEAMLSEEEFIGYLRGNSFKYRWRYAHKDGKQDLKKARWYEDRLLKVYENNLNLKEIESDTGEERGADC